MNSEFNDLERMFSEGLYNHEVKPSAHVWANIQKQKRRGMLFYKLKLASLMLLIGLVGLTVYYLPYSTPNKSNTNTESYTQTKASNDLKASTQPKVYEKTDLTESTVIENKATEQTITSIKGNLPTQKSSPKELANSQFEPNMPISANEFLAFDTRELEMNMINKNRINLSYLIYPSLTPFVYSTKQISKKYKTNDDKEKDKTIINTYSFEIGVGPNYVTRKLTGSDIALRNESESALVSIQTGFKFNYLFHPKWQIQTGLSLENRAEKIAYDKSEITEYLSITKRQVTIYHPVLQPQIITITDSVNTTETTNYKFNTTNKYTTLSIPIILGYNFGIGKLVYRISAGSLINIYSINKAHNLDRINDKIALTPYQESAKIKSSLVGSAAVYIPLNLNYQVFAELSHFQNLNNRLASEAAYKQKNSGTNLSLGLKINILK